MAGKKLILIIDDDPDIRDLVKMVLESAGFATNTAANGSEGIDLFDAETPDLVLCDMMMEQIDSGARVVQEIREKNTRVPVFLLSSIGDATARYMNVTALGFSGVIQKPVLPEKLIDTIKKALGL
ncbi:MAG TPA: response regulator [Spirochaetota bacterium]|nr:response regulator [Spirochaetota bacterium]